MQDLCQPIRATMHDHAGSMPAPSRTHTGLVLSHADRCRHHADRCRHDAPQLLDLQGGISRKRSPIYISHMKMCFRPGGQTKRAGKQAASGQPGADLLRLLINSSSGNCFPPAWKPDSLSNRSDPPYLPEHRAGKQSGRETSGLRPGRS